MTAALPLLLAARARIADPARWTTGAMARNAKEGITQPYLRDACSWCAMGALLADNVSASTHRLAVEALHAQRPAGSAWIEHVNDTLGHAAVLALYDRAIAAERAKEAP